MRQRQKMFNGLFDVGGAILLSTVIAYDKDASIDNLYVIRTPYSNILECETTRVSLDDSVLQQYTFLKDVKKTVGTIDDNGLVLLKNVCVEENVNEP